MKTQTFNELLESIREGGAILRDEQTAARTTTEEEIDVRDIRRRLDLSQIQFAAAFGISVATLRNWEQGRRKPDGPARVLLRLAKHNPAAIIELTLRPATSRVAEPPR